MQEQLRCHNKHCLVLNFRLSWTMRCRVGISANRPTPKMPKRTAFFWKTCEKHCYSYVFFAFLCKNQILVQSAANTLHRRRRMMACDTPAKFSFFTNFFILSSSLLTSAEAIFWNVEKRFRIEMENFAVWISSKLYCRQKHHLRSMWLIERRCKRALVANPTISDKQWFK